MKKYLKSLDGLALISLVLTALVFVEFVYQRHQYHKTLVYGLPPIMVREVMMTFIPPAVATVVGYHRYLLDRVPLPNQPLRKAVPIQQGALFLYANVVVGVSVGIGAIYYVSRPDTDIEDAHYVIPVAAGIWSATIGAVLSRFMKTSYSPHH